MVLGEYFTSRSTEIRFLLVLFTTSVLHIAHCLMPLVAIFGPVSGTQLVTVPNSVSVVSGTQLVTVPNSVSVVSGTQLVTVPNSVSVVSGT